MPRNNVRFQGEYFEEGVTEKLMIADDCHSEVKSDAEVLRQVCDLMDVNLYRTFILTQRVIFKRGYGEIAKRVRKIFRGKTRITREAIREECRILRNDFPSLSKQLMPGEVKSKREVYGIPC